MQASKECDESPEAVQAEPLKNNQLAPLRLYQTELLNTIKEREKIILNLPRKTFDVSK